MAKWESIPEISGPAPVYGERWRNATWMLEQARVVENAKDQVNIAEQALIAEQIKLAEYIRDRSDRQDWLMLSGDQADYVISQMPDGAGPYGLDN